MEITRYFDYCIETLKQCQNVGYRQPLPEPMIMGAILQVKIITSIPVGQDDCFSEVSQTGLNVAIALL